MKMDLPFAWIRFLGFHEPTEIPSSCQSAFDVTCYRMEERLAYSKNEQVHFSLFPVNLHLLLCEFFITKYNNNTFTNI